MRKNQNTRDKVLGVCYITYNLSYGTRFAPEQPVYLWSDFFRSIALSFIYNLLLYRLYGCLFSTGGVVPLFPFQPGDIVSSIVDNNRADSLSLSSMSCGSVGSSCKSAACMVR